MQRLISFFRNPPDEELALDPARKRGEAAKAVTVAGGDAQPEYFVHLLEYLREQRVAAGAQNKPGGPHQVRPAGG